MLNMVLKHIKKYDMLEPGDRVVVGVSGGADSLALIHILDKIKKQIPLEIFIAHVDHGIRGQAAREDALFVQDLSKEMGYDFFLKRAQVPQLAKVWKMSEEEAGRRVRHEFFQELLEKVNGNKIALGQHKDDQAETILYNIIRGTGLSGLSGIKPIRDNIVIRPLLDVSRRQIEEYCRDNGLVYRVDHTNDEVIYTRNRIRHMLIPQIEENFNPNFPNGLVRMGDILRDEEEFMTLYSQEEYHRIARRGGNKVDLPLEDLNGYPKAIKRRIIREALETLKGNLMGIEYTHIDSIMDLALDSKAGSSLNLSAGIRAIKDYSYISLNKGARKDPNDHRMSSFEYNLDIPGKVIIPELGIEITSREARRQGVSEKRSRCIYIDADSIMGDIIVRNRRPGDRFKPLGMKGTKKLKDYFIDNKICRLQRDRIPLVIDRYNNGENIIWIAGHEIGDDYKIIGETRRILRFEFQLPEN